MMILIEKIKNFMKHKKNLLIFQNIILIIILNIQNVNN